jgi:hypothetical protein
MVETGKQIFGGETNASGYCCNQAPCSKPIAVVSFLSAELELPIM